MNPYLKREIFCFATAVIILIVMLIEGCQSYQVTGVCRNEATYAISVMGSSILFV